MPGLSDEHRHGEDLHQQNERLHHRALALFRDAAQVRTRRIGSAPGNRGQATDETAAEADN